jgi:hypothetical protein
VTLKPHQPKLKRPSERKVVTVCLAAIGKHKENDQGKSVIVAVSDTTLSAGGYYSQEMGALKLKRLNQYWFAMIAGKFSQHRAIVDLIAEAASASAQPTIAEMIAATTYAYISETRRFASESVLSRFGLTMEQFLDSRKKLGDSLFQRTWADISQVQVECDLLVFGFDEAGPHIFCASSPTSERPTYITEHDSPSFAAIGSGSFTAESILYSFRHLSTHSLPKTIYHACAAKFFAESASDVGEVTTMVMLLPNGNIIPGDVSLAHQLKKMWERCGKLSEPENVLEIITQSISQKSWREQ